MKFSTKRRTTKRKTTKKYKKQIGGDFNDREKRQIRAALVNKNLNEIQMTEIINILSPTSQILWKPLDFNSLLSGLRTFEDDIEFEELKSLCQQAARIIVHDVDVVGTDSENSTPNDLEFVLINDGLGKRSRKRYRKRYRKKTK
jgi:hypothetical protein